MGMRFYQHPFNSQIGEFLGFLFTLQDAKKLTSKERSLIEMTAGKVFSASGIPKGPDLNELSLAIFWQQLHVAKSKCIELHPELAYEVNNFHVAGIKFWNNPLNSQIIKFQTWLFDMVDANKMTWDERTEIILSANSVMQESGLLQKKTANHSVTKTLKEVLATLKNRCLELHPELADQIPDLGSEYSL